MDELGVGPDGLFHGFDDVGIHVLDLDAIVGEDFPDRELSVTCSCNRRVQDGPVNLVRANQEREVVFYAADVQRIVRDRKLVDLLRQLYIEQRDDVQHHRGVADRRVDVED